jgi:hypothetical protein
VTTINTSSSSSLSSFQRWARTARLRLARREFAVHGTVNSTSYLVIIVVVVKPFILAKKRIAESISTDKGVKTRLFKDKKAFKAILAFLKITKIGLRPN